MTSEAVLHPETVESIDVDQDQEPEFRYIGIEFEYPVATEPTAAPASPATGSQGLMRGYGNNAWLTEEDVPSGRMGSDHTGAEIRSEPMNLYSDEPEVWYTGTIRKAEGRGYPFAGVGRHDSTNFGLHLNLSPVSREKAEAIYEMATSEWGPIFFCASVNDAGADPWRHGGCDNPADPGFFAGPEDDRYREFTDEDGEIQATEHRTSIIRTCSDSRIEYDQDVGHYYEFRLVEPVMPNHFSAITHFLRLLGMESIEAARDYARDMVYEANEALTPVQQYRTLREQSGWLESAFNDNRYNDPELAQPLGEIMGDL